MRDWFKVMLANLAAGALLVWWLRRTPTAGQSQVPGAAAGGTGTGASASALSASYTTSPAAAGPDYSALAAAISALAAGVALPNILTVQQTVSAGVTELVAATGGRRVCVLAFSVTASGTATVKFGTGGVSLWRVDLDAPAGKSGANLATAWPGFLFAGAAGQNLEVDSTAAAELAITYWTEAA